MDWSTDQVELAVLGTLVAGRGPAPKVVELLRPDDFTAPWRGDVIAWLRDRQRAPLRVFDSNSADAIPVWARIEPGRVAQLMEAAGPTAYLLEYARALVEASTARAVAGIGVVLHAGALSAAMHGDLEVLGYSVRAVRTVIDDSRMRLSLLRSLETINQADIPRVGTNATFDAVRLSADRAIQATPRADPARVAEVERRFISALINKPEHAPYWTTSVGSAAIVSRPWRAVYEAVGRLAREERPIDLVTVSAEMRRGSRAHGAGPQEEQLRTWVENGVADDPQFWGRAVAAHRLRRGGAGAAQSLREAAENPGISVDDLLDTAEILTVALTDAAKLVAQPSRAPRRLPRGPSPGATPSAGMG